MGSSAPRRERFAFRAAPAAVPDSPLVTSYSIAVPPILPGRIGATAGGESVAADASPAMSLRADRTCYRISLREAPAYAVTGAGPDQPIHWTLMRDGVVLVEDQVFEAATDGAGEWMGSGGPWRGGQEGLWVVTARTGDQRAHVQFLVAIDAEEVPATQLDQMLGVSHVAGHYRFSTPGSELQPDSFLVEGARHVLNLGARHVFVHLSPQYRVEYPFDDFGGSRPSSLVELAAGPQFRGLFALPFETFILTTYSFANWAWLLTRGQAAPVPVDADAEQEEIAALVRHLIETYPGKRFILKNWEGDWQLKNSLELDPEATAEQVVEFVTWLRARQQGVVEGRQGDGERVQFAIEFNHVHAAQRLSRSMLTSVIPQVASDLIAYSSWWTLAQPGDLGRRIADDLAFVRQLPGIGDRPLIITEFGFQGKDPARGVQTETAVRAFALAGIPLAIYWQIFDNIEDIGLVGRGLQRLPSWHSLRNLMGARNRAVFQLEQCRIPDPILARRAAPVHLAIRNEGLTFDPVVGYALGLFDLRGVLHQTIWLTRELVTGESVEIDFILRPPAQPGTYVFQMLQHGVEAFGDELPIEVLVDPAGIAH